MNCFARLPRISCHVLLIVFASFGGVASSVDDERQPVKVFILAGQSNMTHFISDMRNDLDREDLPFVIATSGMGGPDATGVAGFLARSIEPAQIAAAEIYDRCVAVPTRHFQIHKPGRQKSHWHNSAESYCLVGDAAARDMIEILSEG